MQEVHRVGGHPTTLPTGGDVVGEHGRLPSIGAMAATRRIDDRRRGIDPAACAVDATCVIDASEITLALHHERRARGPARQQGRHPGRGPLRRRGVAVAQPGPARAAAGGARAHRSSSWSTTPARRPATATSPSSGWWPGWRRGCTATRPGPAPEPTKASVRRREEAKRRRSDTKRGRSRPGSRRLTGPRSAAAVVDGSSTGAPSAGSSSGPAPPRGGIEPVVEVGSSAGAASSVAVARCWWCPTARVGRARPAGRHRRHGLDRGPQLGRQPAGDDLGVLVAEVQAVGAHASRRRSGRGTRWPGRRSRPRSINRTVSGLAAARSRSRSLKWSVRAASFCVHSVADAVVALEARRGEHDHRRALRRQGVDGLLERPARAPRRTRGCRTRPTRRRSRGRRSPRPRSGGR